MEGEPFAWMCADDSGGLILIRIDSSEHFKILMNCAFAGRRTSSPGRASRRGGAVDDEVAALGADRGSGRDDVDLAGLLVPQDGGQVVEGDVAGGLR